MKPIWTRHVLPAETVSRVKGVLAEVGGVLAETRRVDTGRLDIPVFMSVCGPKAKEIMPTRKQMGKGASEDQAEASALMELVERYSFFSFFTEQDGFEYLTWAEAVERFGDKLIAIEELAKSVEPGLDPGKAAMALDLFRMQFVPAYDVAGGREVIIPVDWFKLLNEFNGSSAGNTPVESILQGTCELVERHVCAEIDRDRAETPTIDPASTDDPVFQTLYKKFTSKGIKVILKDFSLGMPVPTVAAVAYDPATFPALSEIVFTAGTAASPVKAAIRALTEVAQLGGDFEACVVYEASGLSKFTSLDKIAWLKEGPVKGFDTLPDISDSDMLKELTTLAKGLQGLGYSLFSVDITSPRLSVPANYNIVPGFQFRERAEKASMGMFVGRKLAEETEPFEALAGLEELRTLFPDAHYHDFFQGLVSLRLEDVEGAVQAFAASRDKQPTDIENGLAAFYQAHALSLLERWDEVVPVLKTAIAYDPEVMEFFNLRGVAFFKAGDYSEAAEDFKKVLELDKGSAQGLANLGACYKKMGNIQDAREALESALELDPGLEMARAQLQDL